MFSIIAAIGKNRELGLNGQLIFHIKEDMKFFRETTSGHKIVMGRKTWESLPGKLPNRENIVISRHPVDDADTTITDLTEFIAQNKDTDEEILGAAYANLSSCCIMMQRYTEAENAWNTAQQYPAQPGADATAAILYAAMGNSEKTAQHIEILKVKFPSWVAQTQEMTEQILSGIHPAFQNKKEEVLGYKR